MHDGVEVVMTVVAMYEDVLVKAWLTVVVLFTQTVLDSTYGIVVEIV
jgi:hypothetical protein